MAIALVQDVPPLEGTNSVNSVVNLTTAACGAGNLLILTVEYEPGGSATALSLASQTTLPAGFQWAVEEDGTTFVRAIGIAYGVAVGGETSFSVTVARSPGGTTGIAVAAIAEYSGIAAPVLDTTNHAATAGTGTTCTTGSTGTLATAVEVVVTAAVATTWTTGAGFTWSSSITDLAHSVATGNARHVDRGWKASAATTAINATLTHPSSTVTRGAVIATFQSGGINVTPAALEMDLLVQAPTTRTDANPAPANVEMDLLVQAPTITSAPNVAPGALEMDLLVQVPDVHSGTDVAVPAAIQMPLAVQPATVVSDTAIPPPGALEMDLLVQVPTTQGDTAVPVPAPVSMAMSFPAVTVQVDAAPTPTALTMSLLVQTPTVVSDTAARVPAAVSMSLSVQTPTALVSIGRDLALEWDILAAIGRDLVLEWIVRSDLVFTSRLTDADLLDLRFVGLRSACFRWEVLDQNNRRIGVCHPYVGQQPPTITNDTTRTTKRDLAGFALTPDEQADINPFSDRIRPVMILPNGSEYQMGVFLFVSANRSPHSYGRTFSASLLDQCWIVDQATDHTIGFSRGDSVRAAIQRVLALVPGVTVVVDSVATILGGPVVWPAGTSVLKIVNDLAALASCYDLYFDNGGTGRIRAIPTDITTIPVSVDYVEGSCGAGGAIGNLVEGSTVETENLLSAPNRIIVIDSSAPNSPIVGRYDIPASSPNSFFNRGEYVVQVINEQGLASVADATARALAAAVQSANDFSWWSFQGVIDPRHDTYDILRVRGSLVREQKWSTQVQEGSPMSHDVRLAYA